MCDYENEVGENVQMFSYLVRDGGLAGVVVFSVFAFRNNAETIYAALKHVDAVLRRFGYEVWYPSRWMIDDCPAEHLALSWKFPFSILALCVYHVVHRNLTDTVTAYVNVTIAKKIGDLVWALVRRSRDHMALPAVIDAVQIVYGLLGSPAVEVASPYHPDAVRYRLRTPSVKFVDSGAGAAPATGASRPVSTGARPVAAPVSAVPTGARPVPTGARPVPTGVRPVAAPVSAVPTGARPPASDAGARPPASDAGTGASAAASSKKSPLKAWFYVVRMIFKDHYRAARLFPGLNPYGRFDLDDVNNLIEAFHKLIKYWEGQDHQFARGRGAALMTLADAVQFMAHVHEQHHIEYLTRKSGKAEFLKSFCRGKCQLVVAWGACIQTSTRRPG